MPNILNTIVHAITARDFHTANEGITQVLQQKVADRLVAERKNLNEVTDINGKVWNNAHCNKCGHDWLTSDNKGHCVADGCMTGKWTTVTSPDGKILQAGERPKTVYCKVGLHVWRSWGSSAERERACLRCGLHQKIDPQSGSYITITKK